MEWKVGDEFIVTGDEKLIIAWSLTKHKNTVRKVLAIYGDLIEFENPISGDPLNNWNCPTSCARKLTKLDKALK